MKQKPRYCHKIPRNPDESQNPSCSNTAKPFLSSNVGDDVNKVSIIYRRNKSDDNKAQRIYDYSDK